MNRFDGRRRGGRATREQLIAQNSPSASELLAQIRHWLVAMERFRSLWRDAPRLDFTRTGCGGEGGNHNWHVRLAPKPPHRTSRVVCTTPLINFPPVTLMQQVILPLRREGFEVADPIPQRCGCATFTAKPRRLAAG
jgi:hypothetical protein